MHINNVNTRQAEMVTNERLEYEKCEKSIIYFAEKYVKVSRPEGVVKYDNSFNDGLIGKLYENKTLLVAPRQTGKSTISLIKALHAFIFKDNVRMLYVGDKWNEAQNSFNNIYDKLPVWMKPTLSINNVKEIKSVDNNTIMFRKTKCTTKCTTKCITLEEQKNVNMLIIDVFEFINIKEYKPLLLSEKVSVFWTSLHDIDLQCINLEYFDKYVFNVKDASFYSYIWKKNQIQCLGIHVYNQEYQLHTQQ